MSIKPPERGQQGPLERLVFLLLLLLALVVMWSVTVSFTLTERSIVLERVRMQLESTVSTLADFTALASSSPGDGDGDEGPAIATRLSNLDRAAAFWRILLQYPTAWIWIETKGVISSGHAPQDSIANAITVTVTSGNVVAHAVLREADALVDWQRTAWRRGTILLTLSIAFISLTSFLLRALQQREIAESRYRALIENAPFCIHEIDLMGKVLSMNQAGLMMLGVDKEEKIRGVPYLSLVSDGDRERISALLQDGLLGKESHFEFAAPGDMSHYFESCFIPLRDGGGKVAKLMGLTENITERKKREAETHIAATAFESQDGVMITDANSLILRINQAFTDITGYTPEDVVGKTPRILNSGLQDENFFVLMKECLRKGSWEGDIWNRRKNGEVYLEHLAISSVRDPSGGITHYIALFADVHARKATEEEIKNLAFYDSLTHLPNRRLLLNRLHRAFVSCRRTGLGGALMFIDLDNFKAINDTLGHGMGDVLLQRVAQRLTSCIREGDSVARLGGDEFVVMLEGLSKDMFESAAQAQVVGEKILASLSHSYLLGTHECHNTPSIGVTLFGNHKHSAEELLKQADIAMYQAKKAGRNTLQFFNQQMQDSINTHSALENELRKALETQQFQLYYQIQMDKARRPSGVEALIRWIHPERGIVPPTQFIALAEETGLILPMGRWVLEAACAQIKAWEKNPLTRDLILSVNVSSKQFHQADFVTQMQALLQQSAINPKRLKLELTESLLLENTEETIVTMNLLKEAGVLFSLDDFGTGYSSLQYLKRLPLDQLKIDQSFVRDLATDKRDKEIVRTIIAMAESLSLDVIAEGVETEEQFQILSDKGCTHYQGYLFSKPVPLEPFEALLGRKNLVVAA